MARDVDYPEDEGGVQGKAERCTRVVANLGGQILEEVSQAVLSR